MSALRLPLLLERAGCTLAERDDQAVVLDRDGRELARGPRLPAAWLWNASAATLIERQAERLGFCHERHPERLQVRLWRPGLSRAAPWQDFPDALAWLGRVERAVARHRRRGLRRVRRPLRVGRCP